VTRISRSDGLTDVIDLIFNFSPLDRPTLLNISSLPV
jgi:hypothetical protein